MNVTHSVGNWDLSQRRMRLGQAICINLEQLELRPYPILSAIALAGFYVGLDVDTGLGLLPNVIGGVFGLTLLALHLRRVNPRTMAWLGGLVALYATFAVVATVVGNSDYPILLPSAQLVYTVISGYGLFLDLTLWSRADISSFFKRFAVFILIGAALEVYSPLRPLITMIGQVHNLAHPDRDQLAIAARDLGTYGQVRPKFFTEETSFVGIGFGLFAALWLLSAQKLSGRIVVQASIMVLLGLFVIRSPFVILPALMIAGEAIFHSRRVKGRSQFTAVEFVLFGMATIFVFSVSGILFSQIFGTRLGRAQTGGDWSITVRTYGAVLAGWRVALEHPLFGVGPGNFEAIRATQLQTYADLHVPDYALTPRILRITLNNGLAATLAFFGLAGSVIYFYIVTRIGKSLDHRVSSAFILCAVLLTYVTAGSIYSPKGVWPIFLILAAVRDRRAEGQQRQALPQID